MSRTSSAFAGLILLGLCLPAAAQESWSVPRTPDGHADLQGTWTNSSITVLERTDASLPLVLSPEQAKRLEQRRAAQGEAGAARTNPEEGAPSAGKGVGGYNQFWLDRGAHVGRVSGEARSSWIVDPPNGRIPFSADGRKRIAAILAKRSEDGPEGMNPADRCLIGSRGSGGPPMLNNMYNNNYQIVQTPGAVMIDVEMMHDARIIRMSDTERRPDPVRQWLGDSVGHWDGDTLVVVTHGWKKLQEDYEPIYLSDQATVTERFTRTGRNELLYQFSIDDPVYYTQVWKGEMTFSPSNGPVYEYACHEGNYALPHILAGARMNERRGIKTEPVSDSGE
ncbi:MAG: hypothetical protein GC155_11085 [Alphaproteobacteria bacterium]|nr:hypothetical protein [Alphaproteobacteria bacterium]